MIYGESLKKRRQDKCYKLQDKPVIDVTLRRNKK